MSIDVQFKTILFSFVFGFLFSLLLGFNYKFMTGHKLYSFFISFFFVVVNVLLYFIFLRKINGGIYHNYEVFCIVLGFFMENLLFSLVYKRFKR